MSNYTIGIDMGKGEDETCYCITRRTTRFMHWINMLLKRGDTWKIVYCGTDPSKIRKWRYKSARILEDV